MRRVNGFTLIELLIVMGILATLMAVLLGGLGTGAEAADEALCEMRLRQLGGAIQIHQNRYRRLPRGGGTDFLHDLWQGSARTEHDRDLNLCPAVQRIHDREDLRSRDPAEIWQTREEFTSDSTDYAFRAAEHRRTMMQNGEAWASDDNEHGHNHPSGAVHVLYKHCRVERVFPEDRRQPIVVGPDSEVEALRKLTAR